MIRFHDEARDEAGDAADHYEGRQPGLGFRFRDSLRHAVALIARDPAMFPLHGLASLRRPYRFVMLERFPYSDIYVETPAEVVLLAVAHHSRKPGYWRHRRP